MKTVKILKKTNIVFLLLIMLMALATVAFGQKISETQQIYGDTSLVNLDVQFTRDSASVVIPYDKDILEIVSLAYPTIEGYDSTKRLDVVKHFSADEETVITFYPLNNVFIKTKRGVTSLYYLWLEEYRVGLLAVNGKIVARYEFDKKGVSEDIMVSEDLFESEGVQWRYGTGR